MFPDQIQTARLTLRPVVMSDAPVIFESYARDPAVTIFMTWQPHANIGVTEAYIADNLSKAGARSHALVLNATAILQGVIELRRTAPGHMSFGYVLARAAWGQGLMPEALGAMADWSLAQPDLWRVGSVCDVENRPSARVMEKAGMQREGVLRRWLVHPNVGAEPRDCYMYARVK